MVDEPMARKTDVSVFASGFVYLFCLIGVVVDKTGLLGKTFGYSIYLVPSQRVSPEHAAKSARTTEATGAKLVVVIFSPRRCCCRRGCSPFINESRSNVGDNACPLSLTFCIFPLKNTPYICIVFF